MRNACMQPIDDSYGDFVGTDMWNSKNPISEDCLYLNVWTPDVDKVDDERAAQPTTLKAVMVYTLCLKKNVLTLKRYSSKLQRAILMKFGRSIQNTLE